MPDPMDFSVSKTNTFDQWRQKYNEGIAKVLEIDEKIDGVVEDHAEWMIDYDADMLAYQQQAADILTFNERLNSLEGELTYTSGDAIVATANRTLTAYDKCYVAANNITLTLPSPASNGDLIEIIVGNFTNTQVAGAGSDIQGESSNLVINIPNIGIFLRFFTGHGWRIND